ncbi:anti-sigma factor antagonist [Catenulispora pinisilvae]|uniref:anti-sigma factor antagonist n=1 Tax=Catenulispora pinisilvae TaxID=2705253 RepID=UPI0018927FB2|nr:anti-sigma factor antagonist [Catenulispora pinisilvae]
MSGSTLAAAFTLDVRAGRCGITVIEASGELDFYTGPMLRRSVAESVAAGNALVVLDLDGLDFLDSTGLSVLVKGLKVCRAAGGAIAIARLPRRPEHTLQAAGVLKLFDLYDTVDAAENAMASPSGAGPSR